MRGTVAKRLRRVAKHAVKDGLSTSWKRTYKRLKKARKETK